MLKRMFGEKSDLPKEIRSITFSGDMYYNSDAESGFKLMFLILNDSHVKAYRTKDNGYELYHRKKNPDNSYTSHFIGREPSYQDTQKRICAFEAEMAKLAGIPENKLVELRKGIKNHVTNTPSLGN